MASNLTTADTAWADGVFTASLDADRRGLSDLIRLRTKDDALRRAAIALETQVRLTFGEIADDDYLPLLRAAIDDLPDHERLIGVLLNSAVYIAVKRNRLDDAERSLRFLRGQFAASLDPYCRLSLIHSDAFVANAIGDRARLRSLHEQAMAIPLPEGGRQWLLTRNQQLDTLIGDHQLATADRLLADLEGRSAHLRSVAGAVPVEILRARWCLAAGRFADGLAALASLQESPNSGRVLRLLLRIRLRAGLDDLVGARSDLAGYEDARHGDTGVTGPSDFTSDAQRHLLIGTIALAARSYAEAEASVRDGLESSADVHPASVDALLVLKGQIELARGDAAAAHRTLIKLSAAGERPDLALAWIRLHLLTGDLAAAATLLRSLPPERDAMYIQGQLTIAHECTAHRWVQLMAEASGDELDVRPPERVRTRPVRTMPVMQVDLIGGSAAMARARALVARFADLDAPVLIDGETGTGKEVVARMLHAGSHRAAEPFVAVNCGALSDTLIESELFGHVKGAFTGASADHPGLFVSAGKGTIFLDEIVSMSPRLQAALLRALETGEVRPVGGTRSRRISARVVAATNRPLAAEVKRGAFRSDLFFRLERLVIDLPPLRDRAEDVPALVDHFLRNDFAESGAVASAALLDDLRHRPWPGNVRELRNVIERMVLLSGSQAVLLPEISATEDAAAADLSTIAPTTHASAHSGAAGYPSRLDFLRAAFRERRRLTRGDAIRLLHCAPETAARALAQLESERFVRRVSTSAHHRTSHFELVAT